MNKALGVAFTIVLVLVLLWLLSSKAQTPGPGDKSGAPGDGKLPAAAGFKVALITPGPVNDKGWSEGAYSGLQKIKQELGAEVQNVVASDTTQALNHFRAYAGEGASVIIGHASEWYGEELFKIAAANPKTQFLISGCDKEAVKNVAGIRFYLEDACYVLGYLSGSMTKSKVLGCVGPEKVPVIQSTFEAFARGAKDANPAVDVRIVWTEKGDDIPRAKELTLTLIAEKADFIFHNANKGGEGVFQAVQEKKDQGVLTFGANADQTAAAPDVILANAVIDVPPSLLSVLKRIKAGGFDGKTQMVGMPDDVIRVTFNPALEAKIPAEIKKKVDDLIARLKSGAFKVPKGQ